MIIIVPVLPHDVREILITVAYVLAIDAALCRAVVLHRGRPFGTIITARIERVEKDRNAVCRREIYDAVDMGEIGLAGRGQIIGGLAWIESGERSDPVVGAAVRPSRCVGSDI